MTAIGIDNKAEAAARARQNSLTKPPGALGKLEDIACWFAARQGKAIPDRLVPHIAVFAGDHGVVDEGVSAYPSVVTGEMVKNFTRGGAAINVLARQGNASLSVVDVGVASDLSDVDGVVHAKVRHGSGNIVREAAMSADEMEHALQAGRVEAEKAITAGANLLIAGDMGIGNTTPSACMICMYTQAAPADVVGRGTGVGDDGYARKLDIVGKALQRVDGVSRKDVLRQLGGLEIAAMAGFYLQAAEKGVPVLIDGFIAAAAALAACQFDVNISNWMLASHVSQESGHVLALKKLGIEPFVDFEMRLGEGSGAALIVPLLQSAIALHSEMATFESAGVTDKDA